ncbi:MAG: glycosyltransferase family 87 protein [Terrimesophilobacter sp.]
MADRVMAIVSLGARRLSEGLRQALGNPFAAWCGFVVAHFWLGLLNLYADGFPLGDVDFVYKFWADQAIVGHYLVGIDGAWVYPIVAIVPMLVAAAFGPALYASTWLSLVMLLDAAAFAVILRIGRTSRPGYGVVIGWWWIGFLALLGPIAMGRIDSITVPLAIVGVLVVATRPRAAAILLTVATWIKVWPAALLAALLVASRERWRIVVAAAATSGVIMTVALLLGSGANLFSFVGQQTARGLQIEAPVSTFWLWQAFAGSPGTFVYYDKTLLTWQVAGTGVAVASTLMTVLMALCALVIVLVAMLVLQRGARVTEVLPVVSLALVSALIAFNKVGSPQFMTWLAVPVILGLATHSTGQGRSFRAPAIMVAALALLTQAFYPYLYGWLIGLHPAMLLVLTARNVLVFVVLGWAFVALWRSRSGSDQSASGDGAWLRAARRDTVEESDPN